MFINLLTFLWRDLNPEPSARLASVFLHYTVFHTSYVFFINF